ncbi:MAG: hypothetical protein HY002_15535 [Candidatus Rokubacteria bacterium]|nr:hypothetical protein [Candidatus Rokubacteria bacterium]
MALSVAVLVTCRVDLFHPDVGLAMARLLRRHGVRVSVPDGQTRERPCRADRRTEPDG